MNPTLTSTSITGADIPSFISFLLYVGSDYDKSMTTMIITLTDLDQMRNGVKRGRINEDNSVAITVLQAQRD